MKNTRSRFLLVGHAEGISFIILLFIAMPLKYLAGMPLAVRIAGSIHGFLFLAFLYQLWEVRLALRLSWTTVLKCFLLSVLPFGTFFLRKLVPEKMPVPAVAEME